LSTLCDPDLLGMHTEYVKAYVLGAYNIELTDSQAWELSTTGCTIYGEPEWTDWAKLEIRYLALPGVTDEAVKQNLTNAVNTLLAWMEKKVKPNSDTASRGLYTSILQTRGGSIPLIAKILIGIVIAQAIIYYVRIITLEGEIEQQEKIITQVEDEIIQLISEKKIDVEDGKKLLKQLEDADKRSVTKGTKWWDELADITGAITQMLPLVFMLAIVSAIMGMIPRRR